MAKQVFLSYSTDDTPTAISLRDHMEAQGIACWMAPRDIAPGKDYGEQIINAIEEATTLLLILSESSNQSIFVRNEVERAVAKGKIIIPYRIQPVQPSRSLEFFISNCQWIEAWEKPLEQNLAALVQAIRDDSPAPAERLSDSVLPSHNLPHQLTPFVGRERELATLNRLLAEQDVRLITILGPGGMGKTRLSLAAAERHLIDPRFAHGVFFVALAPLNDPQHIVLALAEALSISLQAEGASHTPQHQLFEYLSTRSMLLVFDNFEHLLDGVELVAQILRTAPQVRVLATSRERLRVPGEHLFPIQGLEYEEAHQVADEAGSAAAQLFVQSARQLHPTLHLDHREIADVAHICRLVGGMPLGIELAASWIDLLSPAEIATEIQSSLDFLAAERRGAQEQHHSVRAVFDSTWQRLDLSEQSVFARLAIFRGGFTREAAEQIAGASLRLLSGLVGKSLIQHERERGRYTLHELLRQFAEEKLAIDSEAAEETYERFCAYYTTFLQQQEARFKGRQHAEATAAIEAEIENIRSAWQWAIAHHQVEPIDRSLEALWFFFVTKSWFQEGLTVFGLAADALHMDDPAGQQGVLLGKLLARQGSIALESDIQMGGTRTEPSTHTLFEQSLAIFDKLDALGESGLPLLGLGKLSFESGNFEQAFEFFRAALSIAAEQNVPWQMSRTLYFLGRLKFWTGMYHEAIQYCRQGIAICDDTGDQRTLGYLLRILAEAHRVLGDYEEAKQAAQKSLAASTATGEKRSIAWSLHVLAEVAWHMGDFVAARQHAEASLALFQEIGLIRTQNAPLNTLGNVAASLGDYRQARTYFYTILESHLKSDTLTMFWGVAEAVTGMATVLEKEGKTAQAVELLDLVLHRLVARQETRDRATTLRRALALEMPAKVLASSRPPNVVIAELLSE